MHTKKAAGSHDSTAFAQILAMNYFQNYALPAVQADEFESHIFLGQQFLLFEVNNYRQLPTIFFAPVVAIAAVVIANNVSNLIEVN